ncbi:MAG: HupE/UreJ family protein, partial [Spirosomataceae bacterium]
MKKYKHLFLLVLLFQLVAFEMLNAHPMPNSMVVLKIYEKNIAGEIQIPLSELQSAIGMGVNDHSEHLVERLGDTLRSYLLTHIRPRTFDGKPWTVALGEMRVHEIKSVLSGVYKELVVDFSMNPPTSYDLRNFYFDYDAVLHQVASHRILVSIKQDWKQGIVAEDSTLNEIGVIELDVPTNTIKPFQVSLEQGSAWRGFKSMVVLGMNHIKEGLDHLLFLLVLLLPALQLVQDNKWTGFVGVKKGAFNVLKIVTAFTIGHSITLLLGAIGWIRLPSQPVEILIGISILVSAIHAIKPFFAGKEMYIAAGFGLVHGLAFASTLADLSLAPTDFALSILGFNV